MAAKGPGVTTAKLKRCRGGGSFVHPSVSRLPSHARAHIVTAVTHNTHRDTLSSNQMSTTRCRAKFLPRTGDRPHCLRSIDRKPPSTARAHSSQAFASWCNRCSATPPHVLLLPSVSVPSHLVQCGTKDHSSEALPKSSTRSYTLAAHRCKARVDVRSSASVARTDCVGIVELAVHIRPSVRRRIQACEHRPASAFPAALKRARPVMRRPRSPQQRRRATMRQSRSNGYGPANNGDSVS